MEETWSVLKPAPSLCCSKSECEIRSLTYSTRQLAQVKFENKNEILSILTIQEYVYPNIAPVLKRKGGGVHSDAKTKV